MDKKKNKGLSRFLIVVVIICALVAGFFIYKYFDDMDKQYNNANLAMGKIDKVVDYRGKKIPVGTVIGTIQMDGLTNQMPIVEGVDEQLALAHGVGHVDGTDLPGQEGLSVFSGHRETFFSALASIKDGDYVTVRMAYGTYKYKINKTMVVGTDQKSVDKVYSKDNINEESIALITCYPFQAWTFPNERFVAYGDLVSKTSKVEFNVKEYKR